MTARRALVLGLLAVVLTVWVRTTARRVQVWRDPIVLYTDATHQAPTKPRAWVNLGAEAYRLGDYATAERALVTAIATAESGSRSIDERVRGRAYAEANLALVRLRQGDRRAAWGLASAAVSRLPSSASIQRVYAWITLPDTLGS